MGAPDQSDGYIRVGKLRELLRDLDDDMLVVLSRDEEGNGFSPLSDYGLSIYEATTTWHGEVVEPEDYDGNGVPALVLWPTN